MVFDQRNDGTEYQNETEQLRISNIHAHHLPVFSRKARKGEEDNRPPLVAAPRRRSAGNIVAFFRE